KGAGQSVDSSIHYGNKIEGYYSKFESNVLYSFKLTDNIKQMFLNHPELTSLTIYIEPCTRMRSADSNDANDEDNYVGAVASTTIVRIQLSDLA
ncbi:MAG: hypothetical protein IKN56_04950, partial [Clostridia bacterium]|nr:hypothetical protein [Clostridia bacterium]